MITLALLVSLCGGLEGERVLLVAADPESELALRMRDELAADAFDVIVRDDDDVIDLLDVATAIGAVAAVEIHGSRVDLWALGGVAGPEHASLSAAGLDRDVAAVRTAELLRARLLAPYRARRAPSLASVDEVAPRSSPRALFDVEGTAGARINAPLAFDALPLSLSVAAGVAAVLPNGARFGLALELPTLPAHITAAAGTADVSITRADVVAGWRFDEVAPHIALEADLAAGAAWVHGSGHANRVGLLDRDADTVVGDVGVGARALYAWAPPLAFFVDAQLTALAPTPSIAVGDAVVAAGPVRAAVVVGVAFVTPGVP